MADNAEVIKEFLVALGFRLDTSALGKMEGAIGKVAGLAFSFATTMTGAAAALTAFVAKVSSGAEDLYWASIRTRDSVANIRDFQLGISKFGGSAEGALQSLENLATFLRTNPAGEGYLRFLGVQTREMRNGRMELRSTTDLIKQIANLPLAYWLKAKVASRFGLDEKTLLAIKNGALDADKVVTATFRRAGLSADEAKKKEHEYNNLVKDTESRWQTLADVLTYAFMPAATKVLDWTERAIDWFLGLNRSTKGTAAIFTGELVAGLGIVLGTATLLAPAVYTLSKAFGLLTGTLEALGLVGAASPFGWIIAGVALFGVLAYQIYKHWDGIKEWWGGAVAWFREKYNEVAPFLHRPRWEGETVRERATSERTSPLAGTLPLPGQTAEESALARQAALAAGEKHGVSRTSPLAGTLPLPSGPLTDWQRLAAGTQAPSVATGASETVTVAGPGRSGPTPTIPAPGGPRALPEARLAVPPPQVPRPAAPAVAPPVTGGSLIDRAMRFFESVGWTAQQAAGIVANLFAESSLNPKAPGDKGQALGLAQWHPARQAAFASMFGHGLTEGNDPFDEQLKFVQQELTRGTEKVAGTALKAAQTAAQAGIVFTRTFERPSQKLLARGEAERRGGIAEQILKGEPITAAPSGSSKTVTISQQTDIKVVAPDAPSAARMTAREQSRVNGDMVRNMAGSLE